MATVTTSGPIAVPTPLPRASTSARRFTAPAPTGAGRRCSVTAPCKRTARGGRESGSPGSPSLRGGRAGGRADGHLNRVAGGGVQVDVGVAAGVGVIAVRGPVAGRGGNRPVWLFGVHIDVVVVVRGAVGGAGRAPGPAGATATAAAKAELLLCGQPVRGDGLLLFGRRFARWPAGFAHRSHSARQPAAVGEGAPEQVLDLGVGAAQLIGRPPGQGVVDGRVQAQQDALAFAHW